MVEVVDVRMLAVVEHYSYLRLQDIEDDELVCNNLRVIRTLYRGKSR